MDTKAATREIRLNEWTKIFDDRASTDLSIDEHCKLNNLSRNSYYYWLRLAKERAIENNEVHFAELQIQPDTSVYLPAPAVDNSTPEISDCLVSPSLSIAVNGMVINVTNSTSQTLRRKVLEVAICVVVSMVWQ